MKWFAFFLCGLLSACATKTERLPTPGELKKAEQEAAQEVLKQARNTNLDDATRWSIKDEEVRFTGKLTNGDCEKFKNFALPHIKTLRVNSVGGDAFEGLCIGSEMRKRRFEKTVVHGLCVSSCANYLFTASKQKLIQHGIVGYHGNISALLSQDPQNGFLKNELLKAGLPESEALRLAKDFTLKQRAHAKNENKFFKELGISQSFFDQTQLPDKGLKNGMNYTFLLPLPESFERIGIKNVVGSQDFTWAELMGMKNVLQ